VKFALVGAEIASASRGRELELAAGLLGDDVDGAAFGVAAKQGALGTLQDFNAFNVIEGRAETLGTAQINAIDIDADALVAGGLVTVGQNPNAADVHDQSAGAGEEGRNLQGRDGTVAEVDQGGDVAVLKGLGGEHRH